MILQMKFDFGKEKYLAMFLGELLGKTRLDYEYTIEYPDITTRNPQVTIAGIGNSKDMKFIMKAYRKVEDAVEAEEIQDEEEYFYTESIEQEEEVDSEAMKAEVNRVFSPLYDDLGYVERSLQELRELLDKTEAEFHAGK